MYNFSRLINKYSKYFNITHRKVVGTEIDYDLGGEIVEKIEKREIKGAIVNNKKPIRIDNGGYIYETVTNLYCYKELADGDTIEVIRNDKEEVQQYQVFLAEDYSLFDTSQGEGLYIYELKGVVRQ